MKHPRSFLTSVAFIALTLFLVNPGFCDEEKLSDEKLFKSYETQIDLYGGGVTDDFDMNHAQAGVGLGVGFFPTVNFGIGVSTMTTDERGDLVDQLSWDIIARQPIADRLAPYLLTGGDYNFEREEWLAHAGAGIELRLMRHVGTFAEARYETDFVDHGAAVGRAGLRFSF